MASQLSIMVTFTMHRVNSQLLTFLLSVAIARYALSFMPLIATTSAIHCVSPTSSQQRGTANLLMLPERTTTTDVPLMVATQPTNSLSLCRTPITLTTMLSSVRVRSIHGMEQITLPVVYITLWVLLLKDEIAFTLST